jgi:tetratricopeptide (TPR) repeat protein
VALEVPGAWLAAALFGLHPMQVESVAWVTERKNVLSAAFALASVLCFVRGSRAERSGRWDALSLALFAAALAAKTATCFLPGALLLIPWWQRGRLAGRDVARVAPFAALAALFAGVTTWIERYHVGAQGIEWSGTAAERVLVAGRALCFYAAKLVWPHPLAFNYPAWAVDAASVRQWLFPAAVLVALVAAFGLRRRLGRGPLAALLLFAGALLPVLGLVDFYAMRYAFVADHFVYLPSVALFSLFAATATRLAQRRGVAGQRALAIGAGVVLAVLAWRTQAQSRSYRDAETLWRDTLATFPDSWMAHNNLGGLLSAGDRHAEAVQHWQEALRLAPPLPEIHRNLGAAALAEGNLEEAARNFRRAVELDPTSAAARRELAVVLKAQGQLDEAVSEYRESLRLAPAEAEVHADLAVALAMLGRAAEAQAEYEAALALDPDLARAHNNLGLILAGTGHGDEAMAHFDAAVRLAPDLAEAHNNYAIVLERAGRPEEAMAQYREVVRLAPTVPEARYNLAAALAKSGQTKEAVGQYREALRLRPDFTAAETALARLFGE